MLDGLKTFFSRVAQSAQRLVSLGPLHNEYEKVIYVGLCHYIDYIN